MITPPTNPSSDDSVLESAIALLTKLNELSPEQWKALRADPHLHAQLLRLREEINEVVPD